MIKIYIIELIKLIKQKEHQQLLKKLPIGLVEVLNLLKRSFRRLVEGNYTIKEAYKALPLYFYNFLKINLETKSKFLH